MQLSESFLKETKEAKLVPSDYKDSIGRRFLESVMRLFTPLM